MKIAAVTMVWNDNWFLRRWIRYYGPLIGEKNLYVVSHGPQDLGEIVGHANVIEVPRDPSDIHFDERRWRFLSSYASALTQYHDAVICLDVDELLVPARDNLSVTEAIAAMEGDATRCVPGFELFPAESAAEAVDTAGRIAPHMAGAQFSPFYSKSGIIFRPVQFFSGAHGMIGERPELSSDLALMHLRFANLKELDRRNAAREGIASEAIESWDAFQTEGKPFATWRRADQRTRQAFRSFQRSRLVGWTDMVQTVSTELERLRVRRGRVHKFLNRKYEPLRAQLPDWMKAHF
ncbi:glycosyltransferase family 2 protein [Marimonas arenosa]|uniref:Glycosyltransferase family 2 protein n=1 Tax=Marimonas arenosa TaxID=1795305 RepID=A0AAE4B4D3_9RHOB|nr:glycosyltransferase family 2 protein [Marimonas arenosa]MDQ2090933.1 glycosyltransferase family 2 protein [Marimonas arenosa]